MKQMFCQRVRRQYKRAFLKRVSDLGDLGPGQCLEAALKTFLAMPDDEIRRLARTSATIDSAKSIFDNYRGDDDNEKNVVIEARSKKEQKFWLELSELIKESFRIDDDDINKTY